MLLKAAVAGVIAMAAAGAFVAEPQRLSATERERVERAITVSAQRYDEWLGPSRSGHATPLALDRPVWMSPPSMRLESQVAMTMARERFAHLADSPVTRLLVEGIAWHLQTRVVEELFDLAEHQPGHHVVDAGMFGDHVRWGFPSLVVPRTGRDERGSPAILHSAAAVATLERVVGWPALAAALRVLAEDRSPGTRPEDVTDRLEAALGIPLDWFVAALDPGFRVNYRLASVDIQPLSCDEPHCYRTVMTVARDGQALFPPADASANRMAVAIEFSGGTTSMLPWGGDDATRSFVAESLEPPLAVTLDPRRVAQLDDHPLDQQWRAAGVPHARPLKSLAAWVVWLQHAALTYNVLL